MNNKRLTAWFGLLAPATITGSLFSWRPALSGMLPVLGSAYAYTTVPAFAAKTAWHRTRFVPSSTLIRGAAVSASFVIYVPVWFAGHRVRSDVS